MKFGYCGLILLLLAVCHEVVAQDGTANHQATPTPLVSAGHAVDWWFAFKFNSTTFPRPASSKPACLFGGTPGGDKNGKIGYYLGQIGQDYAYATSDHPKLVKGPGYLGESTADPVGATFDEAFNGNLFYVVWNDQFYGDPALACEASGTECGKPWGHSKGMVAWDANGNGFVMQVTTPDWPGSGSAGNPRGEGNSLGCTLTDNDVLMSQDFFALKLTEADLLKVLAALAQEGAVTDTSTPQIIKTGGPQEVIDAVAKVGSANNDATLESYTLSSGVKVLAKAGGLTAPPWQLVSAALGGVPLRVASYWTGAEIYSTTAQTKVSCLPAGMGTPAAVQIATTGTWDGNTPIGLTGSTQTVSGTSLGPNHAKIGVSTNAGSSLTILGDMNQDGVLSPLPKGGCLSSQNVRGGLFFVVDNVDLHDSVAALLTGNTAPTRAPAKKQTSSPSKPKATNSAK
jgi:hypothetical protein